jgi:hypothetical protein
MALSTKKSRQFKLWAIAPIVVAALLTTVSTAFSSPKPIDIDLSRSKTLPNGIYLYGESTNPNLIGKEYMIFETKNSRTVGAVYMPHSEFSCFSGNFNNGRMNIVLIDAYDRQQYRSTFTLGTTTLTASKQPMMGTPIYNLVSKISDNDRRMLDHCKVELGH